MRLAALRRQFVDPHTEIRQAEVQVSELKRQVAAEREALVSPSGRNLPAQAARLAELEADLKFQAELYKASLMAAETTRIDSLKQQRFLAVLSKPLKPDEPWQYWRHKGFFTTLAVLLVGFALTKFLLGMATVIAPTSVLRLLCCVVIGSGHLGRIQRLSWKCFDKCPSLPRTVTCSCSLGGKLFERLVFVFNSASRRKSPLRVSCVTLLWCASGAPSLPPSPSLTGNTR